MSGGRSILHKLGTNVLYDTILIFSIKASGLVIANEPKFEKFSQYSPVKLKK